MVCIVVSWCMRIGIFGGTYRYKEVLRRYTGPLVTMEKCDEWRNLDLTEVQRTIHTYGLTKRLFLDRNVDVL